MRGLVLLTALPPTIGHSFLVHWASEYLENFSKDHMNTLYVLVCTQPGEPLVEQRYEALQRHFFHLKNVRVSFLHTKMPQYPRGEHDTSFWDAWKGEILRKINPSVSVNGNIVDLVFSSESYGYKLAETLGARHIIVDPTRSIVHCSGTAARSDPTGYWEEIIPEFRHHVQKTVTLFGAESTGKTTISTYLGGSSLAWGFIPEYARPFLESLKSPEVTSERMLQIVQGQHMFQSQGCRVGGPVVIRDTDLLSTIGYYRLYDPSYKNDPGYQLCLDLFSRSKADLYLLLSANIPFTKDPLRYGGDKRESTDVFWKDLLDEFQCNYKYITMYDPRYRYDQCRCFCEDIFFDQNIWKYRREKEPK